MPKSYSDFMDEITADELLEGLLGYGLFSEIYGFGRGEDHRRHNI